MAEAGQKRVYKEGILLKRQRGRTREKKNLTFQYRFCQLTSTSFDYCKPTETPKPESRRTFPLEKITIVGPVQLGTFPKRDWCFKIGDTEEEMYLVADNPREMYDWIVAFKEAASDNGNTMLSHYHQGIYANRKWSCCGKTQRDIVECRSTKWGSKEETYPPLNPQKHHAATMEPGTSSSLPSRSPLLQFRRISSRDSAATACDEEEEEPLHRPTPKITITIPKKRSATADSGLAASLPEGDVSSSYLLKPEHRQLEQCDSGISESPYTPSHYHATSKTINTLEFFGEETLALGYQESQVQIWNKFDLSLLKNMKVSDAVFSMDVWESYLAVGSTFVQLFHTVGEEWNRILIADDDSLLEPPQHLVAFTPDGNLATASVKNNVVKLWPQPSADGKVIKYPVATAKSVNPGCICSLAATVSSKPKHSLVAVGITNPTGNKIVELYEFNQNEQKIEHLFNVAIGSSDTLHISFSPDGQHLATGCGAHITIRNMMAEVKATFLQPNDDVCSLCYSPDGTRLSAGLKSGKIKVFDVASKGRCPALQLDDVSKDPSPVSSIAYSKDSKFLAAGYRNGLLQLWRDESKVAPVLLHPAADHKCQPKQETTDLTPVCSRPPLAEMEKLKFNSKGGEYRSPLGGFSLMIREDTIPEDQCITIECGVAPYGSFGPFKFPENMKPVSDILWLCSFPEIEFHKPIEISLEHCLCLKDENDCKSLAFIKADHRRCSVDENGEAVFQFKPVDHKPSVVPGTFEATLYTKHLCYLCVGTYNREDTEERSFCLTKVMLKDTTQDTWEVVFCLSYFISDTCLKLIKKQFGDKYTYEHWRMTFTGERPNQALKIKFQWDETTEWIIACTGPEKISENEVRFWDYYKSAPELIDACDLKVYPPRFVLKVCGKNASRDTVLKINFDGANEDMRREIPLIKVNRPVSCSEESLENCGSGPGSGTFSFPTPQYNNSPDLKSPIQPFYGTAVSGDHADSPAAGEPGDLEHMPNGYLLRAQRNQN